jgi:hypothetical protein
MTTLPLLLLLALPLGAGLRLPLVPAARSARLVPGEVSAAAPAENGRTVVRKARAAPVPVVALRLPVLNDHFVTTAASAPAASAAAATPAAIPARPNLGRAGDTIGRSLHVHCFMVPLPSPPLSGCGDDRRRSR